MKISAAVCAGGRLHHCRRQEAVRLAMLRCTIVRIHTRARGARLQFSGEMVFLSGGDTFQ